MATGLYEAARMVGRAALKVSDRARLFALSATSEPPTADRMTGPIPAATRFGPFPGRAAG